MLSSRATPRLHAESLPFGSGCTLPGWKVAASRKRAKGNEQVENGCLEDHIDTSIYFAINNVVLPPRRLSDTGFLSAFTMMGGIPSVPNFEM